MAYNSSDSLMKDTIEKRAHEKDVQSTQMLVQIFFLNLCFLLIVLASFNIIRKCRGDNKGSTVKVNRKELTDRLVDDSATGKYLYCD